MKAAFLAIGDEVVAGLGADTNSGFIAGELRAVGGEAVGGFSVSDDEDDIARTLERATADAEPVGSTGGLGPTAGDLTTAVVARVAGRALRMDEASLAAIAER